MSVGYISVVAAVGRASVTLMAVPLKDVQVKHERDAGGLCQGPPWHSWLSESTLQRVHHWQLATVGSGLHKNTTLIIALIPRRTCITNACIWRVDQATLITDLGHLENIPYFPKLTIIVILTAYHCWYCDFFILTPLCRRFCERWWTHFISEWPPGYKG